jgi:arginine repressor
VLVHGGGKRITEWLERLGVPTRFEDGLRVTDPAALEVAAAVLRGVVNSELVTALRDLGVDAVGLSGVDGGLLIGSASPASGSSPIVGVRRDLLDAILVANQVPVVAPLARDEEGIVCNVNADDAAAGLAAGLGARQLVLMTDVDGVRGADGRKLDSLTVAEAEALIETGRSRRHGAQGPRRPRRARLGGLRGDHLRLVRARGPDARPRRPGVRHARLGLVPDGRCGMTPPKRDRQRAIRRLVATQPVGSQGDLVAALAALGHDVTQATVSRDIAELGLVKARAATATSTSTRRTSAPPRDARPTPGLRRILADIPVTINRSGLILVLVAQPGTASVIAQAIDESTLDEQAGTLAGDNTLIVLFADEPRLERWLERFRAIQDAGVRAGGPHGGFHSMNKVVLAYSGGLDTSVAVAWLREQYGVDVITLTVDVGGGSLREGVERRAIRAGAAKAYVVDARERSSRDFVWPRSRQRALPGRLPAGHGARPPAHRPAPRRGRAARGCGRGRARLHRQGQRPGPLRRRGPRARPGLEVVAPMRVGMGLTREQEIDYASARGIEIPITKASPYSIDVNLWGRSCETGVLEDPWVTPRRRTRSRGPWQPGDAPEARRGHDRLRGRRARLLDGERLDSPWRSSSG